MSVWLNHTNLTESGGRVHAAGPHGHALLGACLALAALICAGGVFSLARVLRARQRSAVCVIVGSLSVADLLCVASLCLTVAAHWGGGGAASGSACTASGMLYVFHGLASSAKACLIVARVLSDAGRVLGALALVWVTSLAVSALPLCGWGRYARASLGCLPCGDGSFAPFLFALHALCAAALVVFAVPLAPWLLCCAYARHAEGAAPSLSRESLERSFGGFGSNPTAPPGRSQTSPVSGARFGKRHCDVMNFTQKRFSVILAMARILMWMPMMTQILMSHVVQVKSEAETWCFLLTLLSASINPLFFLSQRWTPPPCGCIIDCARGGAAPHTVHKRRFQFDLSFQRSYSVYRIPAHPATPTVEIPPHSGLDKCHLPKSGVTVLSSTQTYSPAHGPTHGFTHRPYHNPTHGSSSAHGPTHSPTHGSARAPAHSSGSTHDPRGRVKGAGPGGLEEGEVFEGPERRRSHEESREIKLTDWEWCRSKSERTPRQRSSGGLAVPLCAFQGTVSLQAPTGKTLSLSTYEVSGEGLGIAPGNARKLEVYRSKSVGHEPSAGGHAGCRDPGGGAADTSVRIHLEVLEICENEEALDGASIVSNVSQASARSPSLRYSRRENRFVCCELGETASYSLLIPGSNPDAHGLGIRIPHTVEAHRQSSDATGGRAAATGDGGAGEQGGYREEIQLLNQLYGRQEGDGGR